MVDHGQRQRAEGDPDPEDVADQVGAEEVLAVDRRAVSRVLSKCINTLVLTQFFNRHPKITVNASCLPDSENFALAQSQLFLGLPAPLLALFMKRPFDRNLSFLGNVSIYQSKTHFLP